MESFDSESNFLNLIFLRKNLVVLMVVLGLTYAAEENQFGGDRRGGPGGKSGHGGGFSRGRNCTIVDSTVTSCVGATGTNCSDSASLLVYTLSFLYLSVMGWHLAEDPEIPGCYK